MLGEQETVQRIRSTGCNELRQSRLGCPFTHSGHPGQVTLSYYFRTACEVGYWFISCLTRQEFVGSLDSAGDDGIDAAACPAAGRMRVWRRSEGRCTEVRPEQQQEQWQVECAMFTEHPHG